MAQYTYLFMDILTQQINAELPCERATMSTALNSAGRFTGYVPLQDPNVQRMDPINTTEPGRTAVLVDRDGTLIWGGPLWTRKWDTTQQLLELGASDFLSYFQHRYLSADRVYTSVDQLAIVRDLVAFAQGISGGNIHVNVSSNSSGILRSQTWYGYELQEIAKAIQDLAALEQGFDFAFDIQYVGGVPTITLNLSYPRRGRTADVTGWMWEYPGNVANYIWPEDGSLLASTSWAVGSGSGTSMIFTSASSPALTGAGWPAIEQVISYKDVTDASVLASHAAADVAAASNPVTLPQLTVRADIDPILGSYIVGDDARVRITDARFPAAASGGAGIDTTLRIHQIDVTPPSDQSPEQAVLTMGPTQT